MRSPVVRTREPDLHRGSQKCAAAWSSVIEALRGMVSHGPWHPDRRSRAGDHVPWYGRTVPNRCRAASSTSERSNTIGADPRVLALLEQYGIKYTIHLPS